MKQLKEAIQQVTNIEVAQQKLLYLGRIVDKDSERIGSYELYLSPYVDIAFLTIVDCNSR